MEAYAPRAGGGSDAEVEAATPGEAGVSYVEAGAGQGDVACGGVVGRGLVCLRQGATPHVVSCRAVPPDGPHL